MYSIVTPFPELLNYAFFVPLMLRIVLGLYILAFGFSGRKKSITEVSDVNSIPEPHPAVRGLLVVSGICVVTGFGTQIAALIIAILLAIALYKKEWTIGKNPTETDEMGRPEIILLMFIALSLVFLGAGAFAIDLPL